MLYEMEMSGSSVQQVQKNFWSHEDFPEEIKQFANQLMAGVFASTTEIDQLITGHSSNWKLSRMPAVDRNVLRLAVYELKTFEDIPVKVTLNEAIEIAKKFGSEESSSFVNGVLDTIAKEIRKG